MAIYITGDTHGDNDLSKLNSKSFPQGLSLTEKDYVIICGDCACVWDNGHFDRYIQKWYNAKPWTTLFIDGNHENHDALAAYPVEMWKGGKIHKVSPKIFHLMRGQVFNLDKMTFFTMGGAQSVDLWHRTEGKSWWRNEMPSNEEYEEGIDNLEKYNNKVDIVLTHCAPDKLHDFVGNSAHFQHDKLTNFLEVVRTSIKYQHWFCGHYHTDLQVPEDKFTFVYNKIFKVQK